MNGNYQGGKLDEGEQPEETVKRELKEELGFDTQVVEIIQSHLYVIQKSIDETKGVLVVSYLCKLLNKTGEFELETEAGPSRFKKFSIDEIKDLSMPDFYKTAILKAFNLFNEST